MAGSGAGTLDRNDRYYWAGRGPDNWAAQMMEYLQPEDATMWLLGLDGDQAVGYVAVSRDPELESTISHLGVLPERRGEGFVHHLLAAGTAIAQQNGLHRMVDSVDVLNLPMMKAMRRSGRRSDTHPWHEWVYLIPLRDLA